MYRTFLMAQVVERKPANVANFTKMSVFLNKIFIFHKKISFFIKISIFSTKTSVKTVKKFLNKIQQWLLFSTVFPPKKGSLILTLLRST